MAALTSVQKVLALIDGKRQEYTATLVGGVAKAYQLVAAGPAGRLDITLMPEGIGPVTDVLGFVEAVPAGRLVNVYNSGTDAAPVFSGRLADGSTSGKEAHGFVLAAVAAGAQGTVYGSGANTALTGLKPGPYFLSGSSPGGIDVAPPTAPGTTYQEIGFASSGGTLMFRRGESILRA